MDYRICQNCCSVDGVDRYTPKSCLHTAPHREHSWVPATPNPCPFLELTPTGRVTRKRVLQADAQCEEDGGEAHDAHHYGDPLRRHFEAVPR